MRSRRLALFALGLVCLVTGFGGSRRAVRSAIVFEQGGDLYAVALAGSPIVRLTNTPLRESDPAASPDGHRLAFVVGSGGIWTMNLDGSGRRALTHGADTSPTWTSDDRMIYFVRRLPTRFAATCGSIFHVGVDGRGLRRLDGFPGDEEDPAVSPDGSRIAFTEWNACEGGTADVRLGLVDASGRTADDLQYLPGNRFGARDDNWAPAWSPSGGQIAFLDGGDLRITHRDGTHTRVLAHTSLSVWDHANPPAWSPDGRWVVVPRGSAAKGDLWVVHPDGTTLRRVTNTNADHNSPTWIYLPH